MIQIEEEGHRALLLNHNLLVNRAFNANVNFGSTFYLNSSLFNFAPKHLPESHVKLTTKRKRKSENGALDEETLKLRESCKGILFQAKLSIQAAINNETDAPIERFWEENTIYPQFKGVNNTNKFQKFILDGNQYLIPPNCQFYNHDLLKLKEITHNLGKFDMIVIDPPWKNKYIRRIKKAKPALGYKMIQNNLLGSIPLNELIHIDSIVLIWCTNSFQNQNVLLHDCFPRWGLSLVHKFMWFKLNTEGCLIGEISNEGNKQPYEVLFVARHLQSKKNFTEIKKLEFLLSISSIIHSHKPPVSQIFQDELPPNPKCLEVFARYLQPGFTSVGLEVLKLMDTRLYVEANNNKQC